MAELFLARVTGLGGFERLVVIKRLKASLDGAPDRAQGLLDEARIAATLQHGNIVQVHDVLIEQGTVSIVMEYLHGQNVRALVERAATRQPDRLLTLDSAITIALGVCAGLHHAHEQVDAAGRPLDIVHRDVAAENVIVTYDGGVKLIDFGIARAHGRLGDTQIGVVKGRPGYMAPEQVLGDRMDRRTDVHAAAVLLYEMTCGRAPRDGASAESLCGATLDSDAIPPRGVLPSYPEELEAIVLRGMARDPDRRFSSALEMQRALEQFARGRGLDLSSFGLALTMEQLFRDKLEAWKGAQRAGGSLAEHVAAIRRPTVASCGIAAAGGSASSEGGIAASQPSEGSARPTRRRRARAARASLVVAASAAAVFASVWTVRAIRGNEPAAAAVPQPRAPAAAPGPTPPGELETTDQVLAPAVQPDAQAKPDRSAKVSRPAERGVKRRMRQRSSGRRDGGRARPARSVTPTPTAPREPGRAEEPFDLDAPSPR
jgi:eukaryotic-like serine/threonine-protein kinase